MTFDRFRLGILCLALLNFAALPGSGVLHAQSTTQGAIAGTVTDPTGAVIPGASITITNAATGFTQKLASNSSGFFSASLLEPGTYTVVASSPSFATYRADNVVVIVGQITSLLPHLALASSTTQVVVTEQTPAINLQSPDFGSTLNTTALQSIPINNKRWSSLAMETPGVVSDANGFGLVSIRGISPLMNNVEIDGADDNQAFFSEERGRTREAYSTSFAAVREFAVNTGVYSAQYGRAAGGVITSVTKSGTNQIHGQAYFWDRESNWAAFNNYSTVTNFVNGANVTSHIKPEDLRKIYGFTAGGPLIKDKLFWMYTFDQHTHVFPVIGVPYDPVNFYTLPSPTLAAGEQCITGANATSKTPAGALVGPAASINDAMACALAARQQISYTQAAYDWAALTQGSANVSLSKYPGASPITDLGLNSDIGQVPRFGYQEINMPKLDWQITPSEHWSVLFNRLRWDSPGGVQTTSPDHYARDSQGNDFVKLDYGVTELTSIITANVSNQLLYQYSRELDSEGQQPFTPYTLANLSNGSGNIPQLEAGYYYGFDAGSMYYEHRPAFPDERKWQIGDTVYWNKGNHSLTFGVDMVHNYDLMNSIYKNNGDFSYDYVGNYFNDLLNFKNSRSPAAGYGCDSYASENAYYKSGYQKVTGTGPCYYEFVQGFGNPTFAIATMDTGLFVQDNWRISPRLTLELGLRWDKEFLPGPSASLIQAKGSFVPYPGLSNHPSDNRAFGPRVGFAYNVFGTGETVLRGGWGMYFGRITNGNLENTLLGTGSPNGQFSVPWYYYTGGAPTYPNIFAAGSSSAKPSSYFLSPHLKLPEVQEFDLALQQGIGRGTVFSLSYLGALGRELPNFLDVNLDPSSIVNTTFSIAGDPNGKGPLGPTKSTFTVPVYTAYGNKGLFGSAATNYQAITEVLSNVNSNYNAMVAEVLNRSLRSIQFDASYTWAHALDYAQNAASQGATNNWYDPYGNPHVNYGNSNYNVPNRFVAYALYKFPGLHAANPLKWVANGWSLNDSFQMQNGLPFTAGVSGNPSGIPNPNGGKGLSGINGDLNGSGGSSVIPVVGYNTFRYPRRIVDDVRIQKSFGFERGRNLELGLDAYNVANHQNITSFVATYLYSLSGTTLTYTGQGGKNTFMVPNNSNNSGFLYTPRQIEIIGRFTF